MDYMKDKYPALLAILEQRLALAERYLELTEKQEAAITAGNETALFTALDERECLAVEIDSANANAEASLRDYGMLFKKNLDTAKADELLERTRVLYVQCLTLDRKNMKEIKSQMEKATGDNRELQKRREGINKYAHADYIFAPSILDKHK